MKPSILRAFRRFLFSKIGARTTSTLRRALTLFGLSLAVGIFGYILIEDYSLIDAIYMTVITISTVGFAEVEPLSNIGRLFTSVLILFNIGVIAYALYAFTDYVIEGELFKKMQIRLMNNRIEALEEHVIICGYGKYGEEIGDNFTQAKIPFVIIDISEEQIEYVKKKSAALFFVQGDASQDEVLLRAGVKKAKTLIAALPDDTDNVFTVLTTRELNPDINIISRASNPKTQKKLKLAGANHTIMPEQIGGFYMSALVTKPGAVEFFSFVTSEYESDIGFEEVQFEDVPLVCQCKTIKELQIREKTGCNVIGYKSPNSRYVVNPSPDTSLLLGSSFIVLGNDEQLKKLEGHWEIIAEQIANES
ncbi:MAG: NAD-binding protein [Bacteroidota bacterium]